MEDNIEKWQKECRMCIHNKAWKEEVILSGIADQKEYNRFCKKCPAVLEFMEIFDKVFDEVMDELEKEQKGEK